MVVKNLKSLKYHELQKLAKNAGIRANQKIDKLIKALEEHYVESIDTTLVKTVKTPTSFLASSKASISATKSGTPKLQHPAKTSNPTVKSALNSTKQSKKRRRTFELEEPTLSAANTPTSDPVVEKRKTRSGSRTNTPIENGPGAKRHRRNTYDKSENATEAASPETAQMIASIDASQDSAERKANLLSAIDKKIQGKAVVTASPQRSSSQPSQIPRFMAYLASMKKETQQQKPVTPGNKDWTKIHKKEFSKFDSIDVYLEKKQQRKDLLSGSGKRLNSAVSKTGNVCTYISWLHKPLFCF
ncbi:hypothetical protein RRG08_064806 [Elysia crispata]|uniref:Uncharacterized protein n=1 Tax=Elysia crispata TaxID=231223 RepID=A0AAE1AWW4_9GAST|nr:hypothetical protein RRG08_064806 [Elysia crispata]